MKKSRMFIASLAAVSLLGVSACVTDPNTGEQKVSRAAIGGAGGTALGYLLGGVIGGKTARIIGAGLGGVAGAAVGYRMDQQIRELRESTAGSGVDVTEINNGQAILVNLPDGVTFATGSYSISPTFQTTLNQVAQSLQRYPSSLVDVYGHTDTVGSATSNQRLSEQRAQAVADYLTNQGINRTRIRWQGYGETQLRVRTGDNVNEPLNRRVEIVITPITQADVNSAR